MQKTAYEMRISDWSSDVCSSDLTRHRSFGSVGRAAVHASAAALWRRRDQGREQRAAGRRAARSFRVLRSAQRRQAQCRARSAVAARPGATARIVARRSEEHTSELQSLMRISYAVFCLKKKKKTSKYKTKQTSTTT